MGLKMLPGPLGGLVPKEGLLSTRPVRSAPPSARLNGGLRMAYCAVEVGGTSNACRMVSMPAGGLDAIGRSGETDSRCLSSGAMLRLLGDCTPLKTAPVG